MPSITEFYRQLKQRRVIRTGVVYLAMFWALIEVADLLAGAEMIQARAVQWLLIVGVVALPVTLLLSWFLEVPWRERRWLSVLGDVAVILAIGLIALLLAWRQFFTSMTRPVIAVVKIVPTDTRADSQTLATHLEARLRMLLSTRPELRVLEPESALHPGLADLAVPRKAEILGAHHLLTGTLNQGGNVLRLSLQLHAADGSLEWSERFEERMLDQSQLQSRVLNALWPALPLPPDALEPTRAIITECEYPADVDAIRVLVAGDANQDAPASETLEELGELIDLHRDNGLLHLARARALLASVATALPPRKPVLHNLAMADLGQAAAACPSHPEVDLLRLHQSSRPGDYSEADPLTRHPNDARLLLQWAGQELRGGNTDQAMTLSEQAWRLNPLGEQTTCRYRKLLGTISSREADQRARTLEKALSMLPRNLAPTCS